MAAEQSQSRQETDVVEQLRSLSSRVPGKTTVEAPGKRATLIAGQLMQISDDTVVMQVGSSAYQIPTASIVDLEVSENPIEVERETGVDAVIVVGAETEVRATATNLVPQGTKPFALLKGPMYPYQLSEAECVELQSRTDRWEKHNSVMARMIDPNRPARPWRTGEDCTLREYCTAVTFGGCSGPICDETDVGNCVGQ